MNQSEGGESHNRDNVRFCLEVNMMFGFGKSEHDVRITDEELQRLKSGMSRSEQKDFDRRQKTG